MTAVVVAVPARDEETDLPSCLSHVLAAAAAAQAVGDVRTVTVAVAAHRCADATQAVAERLLSTHLGIGGLVVADEVSHTVGDVRGRLVETALSLPGVAAGDEETWLFTTDADSYVPSDWVYSTLHQARAHGAAAAAGLVGLRDWDAPEAARARYADMLRGARSPAGHDHVYGANLAVRLDAYLSVGGFRGLPEGEDVDVVRRLREAGWTVASLRTPVVSTSARYPGRATHGLGSLLGRLVADCAVTDEEGPDDWPLADERRAG
ncbi:MAG: glycosyltransferase [Dermatophilaceae bacterium]